jgi:hypothetical protein
MELTMAQRQAVTKKKAPRVSNASRKANSRILDELIDLTGRHLNYAGQGTGLWPLGNLAFESSAFQRPSISALLGHL